MGGMKLPPFVEHSPCAVPCVKFFMSFNLPDPCRQFLSIPLGCGSLPDQGGFWGDLKWWGWGHQERVFRSFEVLLP